MEPRCSSQGRSSRIYRLGEKNRKKYDREEESYLISRIINEEDYMTIPLKITKLKLDDLPWASTPPPPPSRLYFKRHQKSKSQSQPRMQSSFEKERATTPFGEREKERERERNREGYMDGDYRKLGLHELGDIRYMNYKVNPFLVALKTPLRKYRKSRSKSIIYN